MHELSIWDWNFRFPAWDWELDGGDPVVLMSCVGPSVLLYGSSSSWL